MISAESDEKPVLRTESGKAGISAATRRIPLAELCTIQIGRTPPRADSRQWDPQRRTRNVWVSIADMSASEGLEISASKEHLSDLGASSCRLVPAGTVLLSFKLSIGKIAVAGCDLYTNEAIAALRLPEDSPVSRDFLIWFLRSIDWGREASGSEKVKGATLNKKKLSGLMVPIPSIAEQQRIVQRLQAVDTRLSALKFALTKSSSYRVDLQQRFLDNSLTSGEYAVVPLGDVCQVKNGATPKTGVAAFWGGEVDWITPAEMGGLAAPYVEATQRKLTSAGLASCSASLAPARSVILSCRAPIGYVVINTVPMATNQGCKTLIPTDRIHYKYLYYFLASNTALLNGLGTGATFPEISARTLKQVGIPLPPISEQMRIAKKLDDFVEAAQRLEASVANQMKGMRRLQAAALPALLGGGI